MFVINNVPEPLPFTAAVGLQTAAAVAADLQKLAADPGRLVALRRRCHAVYREHFSRSAQLARWDAELRRLLPR